MKSVISTIVIFTFLLAVVFLTTKEILNDKSFDTLNDEEKVELTRKIIYVVCYGNEHKYSEGVEMYITDFTKDAWGNDLKIADVYFNGYQQVVSAGLDQTFDTDDDIMFAKVPQRKASE